MVKWGANSSIAASVGKWASSRNSTKPTCPTLITGVIPKLYPTNSGEPPSCFHSHRQLAQNSPPTKAKCDMAGVGLDHVRGFCQEKHHGEPNTLW